MFLLLTKRCSLVPGHAVNYNTQCDKGRHYYKTHNAKVDLPNTELMYVSFSNDIFMCVGFIGGIARVKASLYYFLGINENPWLIISILFVNYWSILYLAIPAPCLEEVPTFLDNGYKT